MEILPLTDEEYPAWDTFCGESDEELVLAYY